MYAKIALEFGVFFFVYGGLTNLEQCLCEPQQTRPHMKFASKIQTQASLIGVERCCACTRL